ncbi:MAG: O-antigen ligase family protein [Candidatus Omnitrophica bacterium]|nr:O-antigen ligase family protein [Candidatus Omnitrophota bacterium]
MSTISHNKKSSEVLFEFLFTSLTVLFLLALGSEHNNRDLLRMILCFVTVIFLFVRRGTLLKIPQKIPLVFYYAGLFLAFQFLRSVWALADHSMWNHGMANEPPEKLFNAYFTSPIRWFFYFSMMTMGWLYYNGKSSLRRFMNICGWACFVFAMNAIPACLFNRGAYYQAANGKWGFFYPLVYFADWVPKYWISRFAFANHIGDVIGFGFFPAIGLALYAHHIYREKKRNHEILPSDRAFARTIPYMALRLTMAAAMATAILLIFSRGTMLCFFMAAVIFSVAIVMKLMKKIPWFSVTLVVLLSSGFVFWSGNFKKAWKEVLTVSQEKGKEESSSGANVSGAKIALALHHDHPFFGVGTRGYPYYAAFTAKRDGIFIHKNIPTEKFYAMSHYLQIWAEQGAGAYFYFLFLLAYCMTMIRGLVKTKSRFKFITALSFFTFVVMSLGHAAIGYSMERFNLAMLVFISMGVSLAAVRDDFIHE